jgi:acyl carrier protein
VTNDEIRDVIFESLSEIAPEADPTTIDPEESLRDELDIDSMDFLNFVTALHERLGVSVPETDYPKVDSISGAVSYLASRVG